PPPVVLLSLCCGSDALPDLHSFPTRRSSDLLELFAVDARNRYIEAQDESKRKFVPSVEGCRFCPIKTDCRTLRDSVYAKLLDDPDRKSTRLNSSHVKISYAVFCLKKKKV